MGTPISTLPPRSRHVCAHYPALWGRVTLVLLWSSLMNTLDAQLADLLSSQETLASVSGKWWVRKLIQNFRL